MTTAVARLAQRRQILAWWCCFFVCAAAFTWHFLMIELSNLPQNIVSVKLRRQVDAYVQPLFTQNWNFFAPVPIADDISVIARVRSCPTPARCTVSDWYAVSGPLVESVKRNRFSPLGLVQIMLDNAAMEYHNAIAASLRDKHGAAAKRRVRRFLSYRIAPLPAVLMLRTSAAAIRARYPGRAFDRIQVALYAYHFPRFSHSDEPDRPDRDGAIIMTDWKPFPNVAPFVL